MDYKYIEQLLERYWEAQTTTEEEQLLRDFFRQEQLPAHLEHLRPLFAYEDEAQKMTLGTDFDTKVLTRIGENSVQARRNTITLRLRPFYRAAAAIAIIFTLGLAAQHTFEQTEQAQEEPNYNYASYKDTYTDPQVAYEQLSSALETVSGGLRASGISLTPDTTLIKK